jgi:DNA-binding SARP family transcriptional activator/tetratricopeptide (TPR) repeat protein
MTAEAVCQLTGSTAAADLLSAFFRGRCFIERCNIGNDIVYWYHPLFRAFLRDTAAKRFDPPQLRRLRDKSVAVMLEALNFDKAMDLIMADGDYALAIDLIRAKASELLCRGRHELLSRWINCLPFHIFLRDPQLFYWRAWAKLPEDPAAAEALFRRALHFFEGKPHAATTIDFLCGIIEAILSDAAAIDRLDVYTAKLMNMLQVPTAPLCLETQARVCLCMTQALCLRQPHHRDMAMWMERATTWLTEAIPIDLKARLVQAVAGCFFWQGALTRADLFLDAHSHLFKDGEVSPAARVQCYLVAAMCAWAGGRQKQARDFAAEGLRFVPKSGVRPFFFELCGQKAAAALSAENDAAVRKSLAGMEKYLDQVGILSQSWYYLLSAWQALTKGRCRKAGALSRTGLAIAEKSGHVHLIATMHLCRALALYRASKHERAGIHLDRAIDFCRRAKSTWLLFSALLAKAEFALEKTQHPQARDALQEAMVLGRLRGYCNTWFWNSAGMFRLCQFAVGDGIQVPFVQRLVRRRSLYSEKIPLDMALWPWPIRIFTIGRFDIIVKDKRVTLSAKADQKPLVLLKAVIAAGGNDISKKTITSMLWPDSPAQDAGNKLSITLHRLRKLLCVKDAVRLSNGRLSLNRALCWVDADLLLKRLDHVSSLLQSCVGSSYKRFADQAEQMLASVRGPFLLDDEQPWAIHARRKMTDRLIKLADALVRQYETSEDMGLTIAEHLPPPLPSADRLYRAAMQLEGACRGVLFGAISSNVLDFDVLDSES